MQSKNQEETSFIEIEFNMPSRRECFLDKVKKIMQRQNRQKEMKKLRTNLKFACSINGTMPLKTSDQMKTHALNSAHANSAFRAGNSVNQQFNSRKNMEEDYIPLCLPENAPPENMDVDSSSEYSDDDVLVIENNSTFFEMNNNYIQQEALITILQTQQNM